MWLATLNDMGKKNIDIPQLRKQARAGDLDAQCRLGIALRDGDGMRQDKRAATRWFHKAANAGHAGAQYELAYCYDNGDGVEKNAGCHWRLVPLLSG